MSRFRVTKSATKPLAGTHPCVGAGPLRRCWQPLGRDTGDLPAATLARSQVSGDELPGADHLGQATLDRLWVGRTKHSTAFHPGAGGEKPFHPARPQLNCLAPGLFVTRPSEVKTRSGEVRAMSKVEVVTLPRDSADNGVGGDSVVTGSRDSELVVMTWGRVRPG